MSSPKGQVEDGSMTEMRTNSLALGRRQLLALRGLRLPHIALQRLREAGIYCEPAVSIERQAQAGRYVIRGVESGGSVQDLGAYCSFVDVDGSALVYLQKVDAVGRNGLHSVVVAPQLVRIQMFRNERTHQLLITEHRLEIVAGSKRPTLQNCIVFHGINGTLSSDFLAGAANTHVLPVFRTRSGDVRRVPERFTWAVQKIVAATSCVGCKHCHVLEPEYRSIRALEAESSEELRP